MLLKDLFLIASLNMPNMPKEGGPKTFPVTTDSESGRLKYKNPADEAEVIRMREADAQAHEAKMKQLRVLDDATLRKEYEYWKKTGSGEDEQQWAPGNAYEFSCRHEVMKERGLIE